MLLARAYMKNVNWLKQGEELLLEVLKEDPGHAEAYLLLAQIYRDQGLKARAAHMLRKAAELLPDNARGARGAGEADRTRARRRRRAAPACSSGCSRAADARVERQRRLGFASQSGPSLVITAA